MLLGYQYDFKETAAKAKCSILPPRWNLAEFHKSKIVDRKEVDGKGITIAVLDSGINVNHEAFAKTTLSGKNFIKGKGDNYWCTKQEKHGTMVAGIIKMYAPKAEIYICCVSQNGGFKRDSITDALKHLKNSYDDEYDVSDKKKCQVIVMSGGHYIKKAEEDEHEQLIKDLAGKGVIFVAAIGNEGLFVRDFAFPARLENVISVGGLTQFGYEPAQHNTPGKPDVYAPGEQVSFPDHLDERNYRKGDGTSFAAPAIGGIVALLMQLARNSGVEISDVQLIKKIFSHNDMKTETTMWDGKKKMVLDPNYFFGRYGTPDKFKDFFTKV